MRGKWILLKCDMIEGDVVLIKDENLLRNQWCFGCIYECYIDNDGYV